MNSELACRLSGRMLLAAGLSHHYSSRDNSAIYLATHTDPIFDFTRSNNAIESVLHVFGSAFVAGYCDFPCGDNTMPRQTYTIHLMGDLLMIYANAVYLNHSRVSRMSRSHRSAANFHSIEGIDGSGTTTQSSLLAKWLSANQQPTTLTCEPSQGPIGQLLRRSLTHDIDTDRTSMALLFAADRLDHLTRLVEPRLALGQHVISDRYLLSSLAYQSIDHKTEWVKQINQFARTPDLTIYLRLAPEKAALRRQQRGQDQEYFECHKDQQHVAQMYDQMIGGSPADGDWTFSKTNGWSQQTHITKDERRRFTGQCVVIDGMLAKDVISERLKKLMARLIPLSQADQRSHGELD